VNGDQLKDHPRPRRVIESVCELLISLLDKGEASQVALMVTAGIIYDDGLQVCQDALTESLQGDFAKVTERFPIRFWHIMRHWILAV
jgi:hypothetical protein